MDTSADIDDELHERADGLVPIYTHERWQVFVDLAAYEVADEAREDGLLSADAPMTDAAGVALYVVAERLLSALADEREEV